MKNLVMKIIFYIIIIGIFSSCHQTGRTSRGSNKKAMIGTMSEYKIIKEEKNSFLKKANIEIRLTSPLSKESLKEIALNLKSERKGYEMLWIFYYLSSNRTDNGAWATTHFSPELQVKILGASAEAYEEMKTATVSGEIISIWYDNDAMLPNRKFLVSENGRLLMRSVYANNGILGNGGQIAEEILEKKVNGQIRFDYKNNHGEYYLIERNGNLGLYDDSGKFMEATKEAN